MTSVTITAEPPVAAAAPEPRYDPRTRTLIEGPITAARR